MLIRQVKNALTLTSSVIAFVKYSTYACGTSRRKGSSERACIVYKQRFFVFSAGEYDKASDVLNDLGYIIKPLMCSEEVSCGVSSLSAGQKFKLLTDHFPFPRVFHCGCNRSFQYIRKVCMVSLQQSCRWWLLQILRFVC